MTQNWEEGRELAIAKALARAVPDQYKNSGHFYQVVLDYLDDEWEPTIKPLPLTSEIRAIMAKLVQAIEREGPA